MYLIKNEEQLVRFVRSVLVEFEVPRCPRCGRKVQLIERQVTNQEIRSRIRGNDKALTTVDKVV